MTYRFLADKLLVDIRFQNARIVTYVVVDFVCTGTGHRQTDKPAGSCPTIRPYSITMAANTLAGFP